jgi:hypothetical protein
LEVCDAVWQDSVNGEVFFFLELWVKVCVVNAHETRVLGVFGVGHGLFGGLDGLVEVLGF